MIILGDYNHLDPAKGVMIFTLFKAFHTLFAACAGFYGSYLVLSAQVAISVRIDSNKCL